MLEGLLNRLPQAREGPGSGRQRLFEGSRRLSLIYRKLETCGKPFVAAINGTCMGGGTELTLACHAVSPTRMTGKMGLPEVKVGLFPGAGGTQRVMRLTDGQQGMQFLLQGKTLTRPQAKAEADRRGVPAKKLIAAAKKMLKAGVDPVKPWDKKGFKLPNGKVYSPAGFQFWPAANAIYRRETRQLSGRPLPAACGRRRPAAADGSGA
jgi:3-hydroxyacyl-CoA dehydrogenase/enoyl-CoA hydratase/3-hydroxybutyryl-CoA epimerase